MNLPQQRSIGCGSSLLHFFDSSRRPRTALIKKPAAAQGGGGGTGESSSGRQRKARRPDLFEVEDISPPPQSLGIHPLPPNTHNGDQIDVEGESYVVQRLVLKYRLERGRYKPDHRRVEVHRTGRYLYNKFLETVYNMDSKQSTN